MKAWQREEIRIREMDTDRYNRRMEISIARIQSIKDQNTTLRRERDELQNSLNEVPKIAAATQAKHENQIKALKADAKICKDNNYFLQQSNDKLNAQLREREKESKELEHFKKELRETVSKYEKLQKSSDDTRKDLQATLTELRDERLQCRRTADVVKTLKQEKETVVKEKLKLESTLRTKNEELWGLRKKVQEMERLKARCKQAEEEVKVARQAQEEAEEKIRKLQEMLRKRESFAQELLKQRERERAILGQMAGEDVD
jgi:chromosome segregation ATPase